MSQLQNLNQRSKEYNDPPQALEREPDQSLNDFQIRPTTDRREVLRELSEVGTLSSTRQAILTPDQQRIVDSIDVKFNDNLRVLQDKLKQHPEYIKHFENKFGDVIGTNSESAERIANHQDEISEIQSHLQGVIARNPDLAKFAEAYNDFNGSSSEFAKQLGVRRFIGNYRSVIIRINEIRRLESKIDREMQENRSSPGVDQLAKLKKIINEGKVPKLEENYDTNKNYGENLKNSFVKIENFKQYAEIEARKFRDEQNKIERMINPPMSAETRAILSGPRNINHPINQQRILNERVIPEQVDTFANDVKRFAREETNMKIDSAQKQGKYSDTQASLMKDLQSFRDGINTKGTSAQRMDGWIEANEIFKKQLIENDIKIENVGLKGISDSANASVLRVMSKELNSTKFLIAQEAVENYMKNNNPAEAKRILKWFENDPEVIALTSEQIKKLSNQINKKSELNNPFKEPEPLANRKLNKDLFTQSS